MNIFAKNVTDNSSNNGVIYGLIISTIVIVLIIVFIVKRKPRKVQELPITYVRDKKGNIAFHIFQSGINQFKVVNFMKDKTVPAFFNDWDDVVRYVELELDDWIIES